MSFPRYPAYKDSGVEWLGEVPSHWHVTALKREYSVTLGKMLQTDASSPDDVLGPYLRAANIQWSGVDVSDIKTMWLSSRDVLQLRLLPGDLLISEGGDVGRSCLWRGELEECYFQNSVNRVRPINGGSSRFLYYWMSTIKDKGYVDVLCNKSTIAHFTAEKVAAVPVPIPPNGEQESISHFLDCETDKIDALVAEQEQLIILLKEKRQAVISHAVTKGLDPSVPMKDSGVEWLGEVPAHWHVSRLKNMSPEITVGVVVEPSKYYCEDGVPALRSLNVIPMGIQQDGYVYFSTESNDLLAKSKLRTGDLVAVRSGQPGTTAVVPIELDGCNCIDLIIIRKPLMDDERFMAWYLNSDAAIRQFTEGSGGAIQQHFNVGTAMNLLLTRPPVGEQQSIVAEMERRTLEIDQLLSEAVLSIELLRERRSALISAAVTGQIDVRSLESAHAA
jgi:type I restriction enzyme, S subunit